MRKTKAVISVILAILMLAGGLVPVFAEDVDPETCTHQWRWKVSIAPTCGTDGEQYQECSICHSVQNEHTAVPATGEHTLQWIIDVVPTCVEGVQHQYCSVCKNTFNEGTSIAAVSDHTWKWVVTVEPTCGETGLKSQQCAVCDQINPLTKDTVVPATGKHVWSEETEILSESTCFTAGSQRFTCTVCGGTKTEALPLAEHTWGEEGVVSLEPSCVTKGYMVYTCTVEGCSAQKAEAIPATGNHTDSDGNGQCDVCGVSMPSGTSSKSTLWDVIESFLNFFKSLYARIAALFSN